MPGKKKAPLPVIIAAVAAIAAAAVMIPAAVRAATVYDLYPVKDLCLSSAGLIETSYDPARIPAFVFFARTLAGRLDQARAEEGG